MYYEMQSMKIALPMIGIALPSMKIALTLIDFALPLMKIASPTIDFAFTSMCIALLLTSFATHRTRPWENYSTTDLASLIFDSQINTD